MRVFQSCLQFACAALLLPALLASAYPHSLERRGYQLKLFKYPGPSIDSDSVVTPFVTLTLRKAEHGIDLPGYLVQWDGRTARIMRVKMEQYDRVVEQLKEDNMFLGTGQDELKRVWIIRTDYV